MITSSGFVQLPYTPDLTEGGITYAIRSLPHTYNRMGSSLFNRLRHIVAGIAVELAFRRYLHQQGIPFDVRGATPFTEPDRYDVALGGHRCDIKSYLITHRPQVASLRKNIELLLSAPALVPLDQHASGIDSQNDLYIFAFLTGLVASSLRDSQKALEAGQPVYLMRPFPSAWSKPNKWVSLAPLAVKTDSDCPLSIELGGQGETREYLTSRFVLPPKKRVSVKENFFSLSSVYVEQLPQARVGISSPVFEEPFVIAPFDWGNIWVYGMDICLTGYLPHGEFGRRAHLIPTGSCVFQYTRTRTKNLGVPVAELKPLGALFEKVKTWETTSKTQD